MANTAEKDEYKPLLEMNGWDETEMPEAHEEKKSETDNPENKSLTHKSLYFHILTILSKDPTLFA